MVDTYSLVLQSPSFDGTDGNGEQLPLPGIQWSGSGSSQSTILDLPNRTPVEFSFGRGAETFSIQGVFTDSNMSGENWRYDSGAGAWETYEDALHARDVLHRARKTWETEDAPVSGQNANWDDTGLPDGTTSTTERDSNTSRSRGKVRLILDKTYMTDHFAGTIPSRGSSLTRQFAFLYGSVQGFSERHVGASHRYRIPYQIDFQPVKVKFSFGDIIS